MTNPSRHDNKMMDLIRNTIQQNMWRAGAIAMLRLISVALGLLYVKYYTSTLSIEEVGKFFYLGTMSYILNALVFVPVDSYMQARLSSLKSLPWPALRRLVTATLLIALIACIILSTPFISMNLLSRQDIPLLYGLASMLYLCSSIRNLLNIRGQANFAASMVVLESGARLLAFVLASLMWKATAQTLLSSSIVALAVEFAILIWQARRSLPFTQEVAPLDNSFHIIRTSAALAGGAASNTVQLQGYRVLFPALGHSNTSAVLGVTANIGAVAMSACAQVFSQLYLPRLYQSQGRSIQQYALLATAMIGILLILVMPISTFLVKHLTHSEYIPYAPAIGIGILIEGCNLLIGAYSIFLTLRQKVGVLFRTQLLGAALSLTACLILVKFNPQTPLLLGMGIALSQLLATALLGIYVYRLKKLEY